ncbi:MAG TPA: Trm112 family protein [Actinotalea sp.]|nr:Trm112 family protein [Actinotalea sp.]
MTGPTLEPWVREILRCPACRGVLADRAAGAELELVCTSDGCGLAYPVRQGIPVLLVDEARRPGAVPGPDGAA